MDMLNQIEQNFDDLLLLARGNYQLVEDAVIKSMKEQKRSWWRKKEWIVDFKVAAEYIMNERAKIDNIEVNDGTTAI